MFQKPESIDRKYNNNNNNNKRKQFSNAIISWNKQKFVELLSCYHTSNKMEEEWRKLAKYRTNGDDLKLEKEMVWQSNPRWPFAPRQVLVRPSTCCRLASETNKVARYARGMAKIGQVQDKWSILEDDARGDGAPRKPKIAIWRELAERYVTNGG